MFKFTLALASCFLLSGTVVLMANDDDGSQTRNLQDSLGTQLHAASSAISSVFVTGWVFTPADLDNLVRIDDDFYDVRFSDEVSQEVIGSHVVKKVGGGNTSFVNIVQTPTGIYSTDGLVSNNVQYHGITVRKVHRYELLLPLAFAWSHNQGWVGLPRDGSNAIQYVETEDLAGNFAQSQPAICDPNGSFSCI